LILTRLEN